MIAIVELYINILNLNHNYFVRLVVGRLMLREQKRPAFGLILLVVYLMEHRSEGLDIEFLDS